MSILTTLTACTSINYKHPRIESHTIINTEDTLLGTTYTPLVASKPKDHSGFYPLLNGMDALTARLLLAEQAERTIDAQYYLIKTDTTSLIFINTLLQAANRGVRIRLLIDDVFASGYDAEMLALDTHPNFEIRVFNPFQRGVFGRAWSGVTDFSRINRRMHTKSFTIDNQVTIIGGRNIADEYFGASQHEKFGDLDVVGIGSVAQDVSAMFDSFWNHQTALPVSAFAKPLDAPEKALEQLSTKLDQSRESIKNTKYASVVIKKAMAFLDGKNDVFDWVPYKLIYDSPDKGIKSKSGPSLDITGPLLKTLQTASKELILLSPYFVPRKDGIEFFSSLQARGVKVKIITNSLAANNHAAVHGGYSPSRKPLLMNGIQIFEVRPDANISGAEIFAASGAKATLHTKAFIIDREKIFVGSFNFDPRSAYLNTESGLVISSPLLALQFANHIDTILPTQAFELFLNDTNKVQWRAYDEGVERVYKKEPYSTWRQRFVAGLMRFIPIKGQL